MDLDEQEIQQMMAKEQFRDSLKKKRHMQTKFQCP
jgi:hypothetical protein